MPHKVEITPGEAILLLILNCQKKTPRDEARLTQLKKLYLHGITECYPSLDARRTQTIQHEVKQDSIETLQPLFMNEPCLHPYNIVYDDDKISEDFSRRFFESHLAYEALKHDLALIPIESLQRHYQSLRALYIDPMHLFFSFWSGPGCDEIKNTLKLQDLTLDGQFEALLKLQIEEVTHPAQAGLMYEFSYAIHGLKQGTILPELFEPEREKIVLILQSAFAALCADAFGPPLNIYGQGIFSSSERGAKLKDQPTIKRRALSTPSDLPATTHHMGILKSHQPLSQADPLYLEHGLPFVKSTDRTHFLSDATWVKMNFSHLMHPFVNSISGTMLIQLRCLVELSDISVIYLDLNTNSAINEERRNCFAVTQCSQKIEFHYITSLNQLIEIPIGSQDVFLQKLDQIKHQQGSATLYLRHAEMADLIPHWEEHDPKQREITTPLTESGRQMSQYLRAFISSLLTVIGGHSLYEFLSPLQMGETKRAFHSVPNYEEEMKAESIFYTCIAGPFDRALNKTLAYEERLLLKKQTDLVILKRNSYQRHQNCAAVQFFDEKRHQSTVEPQLIEMIFVEKTQKLLQMLRLAKNALAYSPLIPKELNQLIQLIEEKNVAGAMDYLETLSAPRENVPFLMQAMQKAFLDDIKRQLVELQTIQEKQALFSSSKRFES